MAEPVTIQALKNGPFIVKGEMKLVDGEGKDITVAKTALCRCGHSANKPFCDGAHRANNFIG
ncbi:MAG: CDGSH iron-sulfur domain-containing protein [Rhodospirillales bacterium]|nr:CDGSH iron-sulfur domain-containing protein [Rhodospirillales bacterium]